MSKFRYKPSDGLKLAPLGKLLIERGISQTELARATGVTQACINKLVWDYTVPTGQTLIKLHDYLGVSTDFLLGLGEDNGQRKNKTPAEEEPAES